MSSLLHQKEFDCGTFQVFQDKPHFELIDVHQIHSHLIVEFNGQVLADQQADGILFSKEHRGLSFGIKTADCLPILLIGEKVAIIHAGWRGLATGILSRAELKEVHFTQAYIGPSIYSYEVQPSFKQYFPNSTCFKRKEDRIYFDLQGEAQNQLKNHYNRIKVYQSHICTFSKADYNSYRRDKTDRRNWNIFTLN